VLKLLSLLSFLLLVYVHVITFYATRIQACECWRTSSVYQLIS